MSNWFSKLFGSKCDCKKCDHCCEKEESPVSQAAAEPTATEVKTEEIK